MLGSNGPLVPDSFEIPELVETDSFLLRPLTWEGFNLDFESYMSSVKHLQTLSISTMSP